MRSLRIAVPKQCSPTMRCPPLRCLSCSLTAFAAVGRSAPALPELLSDKAARGQNSGPPPCTYKRQKMHTLPQLCMNLRSMMSAAVPTSLPVEESAQHEGKGGKITKGKDGADGDMQLQHTLL